MPFTGRPSTMTSNRIGPDARSQSQMSWCSVWKCHLSSPVFMSSPSIELVNRFMPRRDDPS